VKLQICVLAFFGSLLASTGQATDIIRTMSEWPGRSYKVHLPKNISKKMPLVLALHGGGGNLQWQEKVTCPKGDLVSPKCLSAAAERMGVVVVYPNGTVALDGCDKDPKWCDLRTWNSGGGILGYNCTSGYACKHNIDDIAFFEDLLRDIQAVVDIDRSRIYATGISNGGAMSFRLACEMSDKIAAIAPVAAGNQFMINGGCAPARPVPLLQIHGDADYTWPYEGGYSDLGTPGYMISVYDSILKSLEVNGCAYGTGKTRWLKDKVNDGTHVRYFENANCDGNSEVIHYFISNGGHKWPDGYDYNPALGLTSHQFNANQVILDFFLRHSLAPRLPLPPRVKGEKPEGHSHDNRLDRSARSQS
jgi:polyhydroxybutyrate depolymerase